MASSTIPSAPTPESPTDGGERLLRVRAAGQVCGVPLADVHEIVPLGRLTRVPGAPAYVLGLMNLRGVLVTVLDLARRLGLREEPTARGVVLLVPRDGSGVAGCAVDAVRDVVPVPGELAPAPGNADGGRIVCGVADHDGEPLAVVDLRAFLRDALR